MLVEGVFDAPWMVLVFLSRIFVPAIHLFTVDHSPACERVICGIFHLKDMLNTLFQPNALKHIHTNKSLLHLFVHLICIRQHVQVHIIVQFILAWGSPHITHWEKRSSPHNPRMAKNNNSNPTMASAPLPLEATAVSLLRYPPEIKCIIYGLLFSLHTDVIIIPRLNPELLSQILSVCRITFVQAQPLLYHKPTFGFLCYCEEMNSSVSAELTSTQSVIYCLKLKTSTWLRLRWARSTFRVGLKI